MKLQIVSSTLLLGLSIVPAIAGPSEGKEVFDKSCKACHGSGGQGNPGMAKMLKVEMRALGSKDVQAQSDADLKTIVTQGKGKMKAQASLSPKQVDDVVAFVRTLKQ
jgi:mono/diheme cytochrome c family protein